MDQATLTMIRKLEETTGKSLDQWVELARKSGGQKHGEIVKTLKEKHGLTHGYANFVTHTALQSAAGHSDEDTLIETQYAGAKSGLRPVYERILAEVKRFGSDVEVSPKKAYVSFRRNKQFALVQPSTATRMDIGLNLKGVPPAGRLEASGSFNAMCSHRVRIGSADEINKEVVGWLRQAYEQS